MEFLAVIPARAGSTRLRRKNLRCLGGKPLVRIAVECACAVDVLREIVVSSDSEEILANALWASEGDARVVPHRRSPELSTAEAQLEPLLAMLMRERPWATHVVLLNPTSPFREPATIERCIGAVTNLGHECCATVAKSHLPNYEWHTDAAGGWLPPFPGPRPRSQDTPARYIEHGACLITSRRLLDEGRLYDSRCYPVVTDAAQAVDIDTGEDLAMARGLWDAYVGGRGA